MKKIKYVLVLVLAVVMCVMMTGCGEKYVDLPEEICREWMLTDSAFDAAEIGFFEELLGPHAYYVGSYYGIDEVRLDIMPYVSMYEVKYDSSYVDQFSGGGIKNPITIKYTGEELVMFRGDTEIGRCTYAIYDDEVLLFTFNEEGEEMSVALVDAALLN